MSKIETPSRGKAPSDTPSRGKPPIGALALEVTPRCDRNCVYCYNDYRSDDVASPGELPTDELIALAERVMEETGSRALQLTGGEPLLRRDLFDIIEGLKRPGRSLSLVTDGGGITESVAARLASLGVRPVQPTLLAADRALHDELKGAPGFDATVEGIARLKAAGVPVSVSFVCMRRNYAEFDRVLELCFALGVEVVAFSRFCSAGKGGRAADELAPDRHMINACLEAADRAVARFGMKLSVAISLPLCVLDRARYPHIKFGRCAVTSERPGFTIDPTGHLKACSISTEILGDLKRETFADIVTRATSDKGYFARMHQAPDACQGCEILSSCGGGCRESADMYYGEYGHRDPLVDM